VLGCAAPPDTGNARLGISKFRIDETAERTTVVGLDARGQTIARLELVHGRFVPDQDYGPGYQGTIDGRKLDVDVLESRRPRRSTRPRSVRTR
jgi:hypothetical protein